MFEVCFLQVYTFLFRCQVFTSNLSAEVSEHRISSYGISGIFIFMSLKCFHKTSNNTHGSLMYSVIVNGIKIIEHSYEEGLNYIIRFSHN